MKNLKTILNEKEQLLNEYKEQVKPEMRCWNNCKWRPAIGLEGQIEAIKMLIPHEEEFLEMNAGRDILLIGLTTTGKGEYIAVCSKDDNGVYNYSYFTVNGGKLELAFNAGNCASEFTEAVFKGHF